MTTIAIGKMTLETWSYQEPEFRFESPVAYPPGARIEARIVNPETPETTESFLCKSLGSVAATDGTSGFYVRTKVLTITKSIREKLSTQTKKSKP